MSALFRAAMIAVAVSVAAVPPSADAARRVAVAGHAVGCRCAKCLAVVQPVVAAPAYNAIPYAAATYNFVGAPVRLQAEQAYTMQSDPQWQQYQQFRSMMAAQQMMAQQQWTQPPAQAWQPPAQQQAPAVPPAVAPEVQPQPPGPLPPPPGEVPHVAQPNQYPFSARIPTIIALCSKCHSGDNAKGEIWLDGQADLRAPQAVEARDRIMREIINLRMPKGHQLTGDEGGAIIGELYSE